MPYTSAGVSYHGGQCNMQKQHPRRSARLQFKGHEKAIKVHNKAAQMKTGQTNWTKWTNQTRFVLRLVSTAKPDDVAWHYQALKQRY